VPVGVRCRRKHALGDDGGDLRSRRGFPQWSTTMMSGSSACLSSSFRTSPCHSD
jgi:hypothetical protein